MKFWCTSSNSSKQQKSLNKTTKIKSNTSFSSSTSYATITSTPIPKSDSGYSETSSSLQTCPYIEQILLIEKVYYENLKKFIIKYSRPLRRFLNPEEIVELFQNIEKICTISESIIRQCEKLVEENQLSISVIYQSLFGVMIDSYNTYITRSLKTQTRLKQCESKISYYLQMPVELIRKELTEFILLPVRHICLLSDLFQTFDIDYTEFDWQIVQNINFLAGNGNSILQSNLSPIIVLQRTDKQPWESKRLEISDSKLLLTEINRTTTIPLSNVLQIDQDYNDNKELHLIIASTTTAKYSRYSSIKMKHVYIRFEYDNDYMIWLNYLKNAIQQAKDQSWSKTNELII